MLLPLELREQRVGVGRARRVARAPRGEDAGAEVVVSAASPAAPSAAAYAEADSEPVKASAAGAARAAPAPPPLRCFTPLAASAAAGAAAALATALGVTLAVFPRPASALSPGSTYTGAAPRVGYPGGEVDLCFRMPADAAYTVPAVDTSYSCRAFALPPGVPLSAVTFTPLINNTDLAHHMLLFASSADLSWTGDARGVFDCAGLSPQVQGPLYVWGAGAPAQTTPAGVGFRVGADAVAAGGYVSTGVGYVVLQIHYANPGLVAGRRDSSGVLMHVTDALRPIDAGMLWVQAGTETIRVPAGRATGQAGDCGATALSGLPPAASVNALTPSYVAFGALLHAHTLATRVWVEQWRGGVRLAGDPLGHDDLYSFGNQHMIPLTGTLAANDRIYVRCVWANTVAQGLVAGNALAAAGQTVTGGESTLQEMCMGFILYYPRVPGTGASASCGSTARTFCDDAGTGGLPRCATYA